MKKILFFLIIFTTQILKMEAQTFTLSSKDLGGQFTLQHVFTDCGGKNLSPQLSWANAPAGTKSFAILMHDKDAPTGSGWWHWQVIDIPNTIVELPTGASTNQMPANCIETKTDYGTAGYGGPCPPEGHGWHQYIITIYALSVEKLGLDATANCATVGFMVNANTIAKASIVAYYKR